MGPVVVLCVVRSTSEAREKRQSSFNNLVLRLNCSAPGSAAMPPEAPV
jgi:hypothetical protein